MAPSRSRELTELDAQVPHIHLRNRVQPSYLPGPCTRFQMSDRNGKTNSTIPSSIGFDRHAPPPVFK